MHFLFYCNISYILADDVLYFPWVFQTENHDPNNPAKSNLTVVRECVMCRGKQTKLTEAFLWSTCWCPNNYPHRRSGSLLSTLLIHHCSYEMTQRRQRSEKDTDKKKKTLMKEVDMNNLLSDHLTLYDHPHSVLRSNLSLMPFQPV